MPLRRNRRPSAPAVSGAVDAAQCRTVAMLRTRLCRDGVGGGAVGADLGALPVTDDVAALAHDIDSPPGPSKWAKGVEISW